ncbi:energy transducer TonB family protein [Acinetobacter tandoii]|uniref:energy transducer TonB family protein n=1 Tax=Acinetobacter tandoii TaxID=202954 RepID=UPI00404533E0
MSQLSTPSMQAPNPMKKKIISALIAVAIGHVGVLWAISQMKAPELPKVEKEPLKVRFVKIQEQPKPLSPKPKAEPKKEQPKPKEVKEVKVVEKPQPQPPKKVEKVQQVKKAETVKPVTQPTVQPQRPAVVSTPAVETKVVSRPAPVAAPAPENVAPTPTTQSVSIGDEGVEWSRSPKPSYTNSDLKGVARSAVILIEADEKGKITSARITVSTGVSALDEKILRSVRNAKFKPYKKNGVAYPIKANLPLSLALNPNG